MIAATAPGTGWGQASRHPVDTEFVIPYSRVVKNVTITLDEEVARWARVWAAQHDTSVSRLVGELLRERMGQEEGCERSMERYLSRPPGVLKRAGTYPRRDDLYE